MGACQEDDSLLNILQIEMQHIWNNRAVRALWLAINLFEDVILLVFESHLIQRLFGIERGLDAQT